VIDYFMGFNTRANFFPLEFCKRTSMYDKRIFLTNMFCTNSMSLIRRAIFSQYFKTKDITYYYKF
jgi:hypothetical protein